MASAIVLGLLLTLVIVVISAVLALRYPIPWRLARRNVRRGLWRSILVIAGLLVATTIISGSLVIGDTINNLSVHFAYEQYGFTDEGVYNGSPNVTYPFFPENVSSALSTSLAHDPNIAAINPEIIASVSARDLRTGVPQPGLSLVGALPSASSALGDFAADNGTALTGPTNGTVYLDDVAAGDLNATAGDRIALYANGNTTAEVAAVVQDDDRGGYLGGGDVFMPIATAQHLEGVSPTSVNFLAVTNTGSLTDGLGKTSAALTAINASVLALPSARGLAAFPLLQPAVTSAMSSGSSLTTLFLALGLFSILAGAMLIVGIFVMMAEERKSEMGMLRAVGLPRRQLTLVYYFEGLIYSAASALAGTVLGVGVGYGLTVAFANLFGGNSSGNSAILASFTVSPTSLVIAYSVGFLLTLITVSVASGRASRLNIVRALRAIPEPTPTMRLYTWLAVLGIVALLLGGLIFAKTYQGSTDVSLPLLGGALLIFGAALVATRFLPNRPVFTAAGIALLVWAGDDAFHRYILGSAHTGTIFVVFVEGILLVLGALFVYGFNSDLIVRGVTRLFSRSPRSVPSVRIGLSYPSRRPFRTAVNLAIFSLVIFTVVVVACVGASLNSGLGTEIGAEDGGFTFAASTTVSVPNLGAEIANNSTLAPLVSLVAPVVAGAVYENGSGFPTGYTGEVYAPPLNVSPGNDLYLDSTYNFTSTLNGTSTAATFQEVLTHPDDAIVDHSFAPTNVNFGFTGPHPTVTVGQAIRLTDPATGEVRSVTIVGIMTQSFVSGIFVNPALAGAIGIHTVDGFLIKSSGVVGADRLAQLLKVSFFADGMQLFNFAQILDSSIASTEGIIGLLEIFVALGLAVGIAGMGIVALRAVVERRTEIGMLRATGMTQRGILANFLLEYSYIALVGIGIGTTLGIWLAYEASGSDEGSGLIQFTVPWANIALVVGVAYALTLAAIWGPSWKAARLPPAEAVRYSE